MKKLILSTLLSIIVISIFSSCKKEETPIIPDYETLKPVYMNISVDTVQSTTIRIY